LGVQYVVLWHQPRGFEQPSCLPDMVERPGWSQKFQFRDASVYEFDPALAATTRSGTRVPTTQRATTRRSRAAASDEDGVDEFEDRSEKKAGRPKPLLK